VLLQHDLRDSAGSKVRVAVAHECIYKAPQGASGIGGQGQT
jgi:hypothetical protein